MRKLVFNKNTTFVKGQYYTFATDHDFVKWAVLPCATINADGHPQADFTPAYYQAKEKGMSFIILNNDSKIMDTGEITTSIWLPKQYGAKYGTQKKEVTLKLRRDSDSSYYYLCDLEYDFD